MVVVAFSLILLLVFIPLILFFGIKLIIVLLRFLSTK